jgi:hypothetical protein
MQQTIIYLYKWFIPKVSFSYEKHGVTVPILESNCRHEDRSRASRSHTPSSIVGGSPWTAATGMTSASLTTSLAPATNGPTPSLAPLSTRLPSLTQAITSQIPILECEPFSSINLNFQKDFI